MSALIEAVELTRILPAAVPVMLVRDMTFSIGAGEFVAVTGHSGSGKSSLLYLLGLLDRPTSGKVLIGGSDVGRMSERQRARLRLASIGFVFQFHFLLPEFSVRENVEIPMRKLGRLGAGKRRERAEAILESLGLAGHLDKRPDQLSGGQRQLAAVARALANEPPIILADEPTGSLNSVSSEQVFNILAEIARERGKTVVAVTHDLSIAERTDRRIELMDGHIVRDRVQTPAKREAVSLEG